MSWASFKSVLEIIRPQIVVTVGAVGLDAINHLLGTRHQLAKTVARPIPTDRFILFPVYHPSPRVVHTRRSLLEQKRDFKKMVSQLNALESPKARALLDK